MKRAKKIQKLQKIQGIAPEAQPAKEHKDGQMAPPAGDLTDNISENFDKFELWFIENGKKIFVACLVILVAVAAFYTVKHVMEKNRAEVSAKFANADSPEKLQALLKDNSSAPEALSAAFALASDHAAKKEYDKAIALYTKISQESKDEFLAKRAALNVAYLTEIKGDKNAAVLLFARIADDMKGADGVRAEAAYGAGRLYYNAKNMASARKYLSLFNTSTLTNPDAGQYAALSKALLNRIPAAKVNMAAAAKPVAKPAAKPAVKKVAKPAAKPAAKKAVKKAVNTVGKKAEKAKKSAAK